MAKFEEFINYREEKWFWFLAYLELGAAISADPTLSAKRSDFADLLQTQLEELRREEQTRRLRGFFYDSTE